MLVVGLQIAGRLPVAGVQDLLQVGQDQVGPFAHGLYMLPVPAEAAAGALVKVEKGAFPVVLLRQAVGEVEETAIVEQADPIRIAQTVIVFPGPVDRRQLRAVGVELGDVVPHIVMEIVTERFLHGLVRESGARQDRGEDLVMQPLRGLVAVDQDLDLFHAVFLLRPPAVLFSISAPIGR